MIRYTIQRDHVGLHFVMLNHIIIRPMQPTGLYIDQKVLAKHGKVETDPFIYVFKPSGNIKEWWVESGYIEDTDKATTFEVVKKMCMQKYLQLQT